jgi:hypothetical protein
MRFSRSAVALVAATLTRSVAVPAQDSLYTTHKAIVAQRALQRAAGVGGRDSVMTWTRNQGLRALTTFLPYMLVVVSVAPVLPMPGQEIRVQFRLSNFGSKPITGTVLGDLDGHPLVGTRETNIVALARGAEASGELWTYGAVAGVHVAHISFANGVGKLGAVNPYDPHTYPHISPAEQAAFLAEDSYEFSVGSIDPILATPDIAESGTPSWKICGADSGKTFPDIGVDREWGAVLPAGAITPISGTVVRSEVSSADFPFAHPFGRDVDFYAMPDPPFASLLARMNSPSTADCHTDLPEEEYCAAMDSLRRRGITNSGVLGFEMDSLFLPRPYRPQPGDRVAAHGEWIVDCGHADYHSELHPPLLLAKARVNPENGELRATVIGRPYSMTQEYEPDHAPFLAHALGQIGKVVVSPGGASLNAEPVIETIPFRESVLARYYFALPPTAASAYWDSSVKYHFVTRPGVSVAVFPQDKYHVAVVVYLHPSDYTPFRSPECIRRRYTPEEIDTASGWPSGRLRKIAVAVPTAAPPVIDFFGALVGIPPGTLEIPSAKLASALSDGVAQSECSLPDPTTPPVAPSVTGSDNQVIQDTSQPYPVAGWLIMSWAPRRVLQLSPTAALEYRAAKIRR